MKWSNQPRLFWACAAALAANPAGEFRDVTEPRGDYPEARYTKVAVVQFSPSQDAPIDVPQSQINDYKRRVADALERQIREAARNGAKLIVTPEFSTVGYPDIPDVENEDDNFQTPEQIAPYVEELNGPTVLRFGRLAQELDIWLVIGIAEKEAGRGRGGDKYYNTLVALNPEGGVAASHRKTHLWQVEENFLSEGRGRHSFQTPFGKVGLAICSEMGTNVTSGLVRTDRVDMIAFGTSWTQENGMDTFTAVAGQLRTYILASNNFYFPDSGVIGPDGETQSHLRTRQGIAYGYVPKPDRAR